MSSSVESSEDDWDREDFSDIPLPNTSHPIGAGNNNLMEANDEEWQIKLVDTTEGLKKEEEETYGEPMIIVDMTELSKSLSLPDIHSKFDPNSVNDTVAVQAIRKRIEQDYDAYAKNQGYLADRTVIPCGSSVWRPALIQLRKERPGHYFCPIFPFKK
jgi:hypothetical protein